MKQFKNYESKHNRKYWKKAEYFLDDKNFPIMIIEQDDTEFIKNGLDFYPNSHGYGNGYVGIPPSHPWYGMDYDELNEILDIENGLTFGNIDPDKDFYWIGFDTNHPRMDKDNWGKDKMIEQCMEIIRQAKEVKEYSRRL